MPGYFKELQRRNVFRAVIAYVVLAWILLQVSTGLEEALNLPAWFDAVITATLVIGLPIVAVFSWIYELTPDGVKKTEDVPETSSVAPRTGRRLDIFTAIGVVILIGLVLADKVSGPADEPGAEPVAATDTEIAAPPETTSDKSIAVLPFVAMTDSKDDEFFADGLSEELLNVLAKIDDLKVAGRTSAFYYKGRNEDLRVIADALGVAHILEGSVRRSGNRIRVTAQLIKADDGFHLWSQTFDRLDGDVFKIQDEISKSVAQALQAEILGTVVEETSRSAKSLEAQNFYLVAQAALAQRNLADVRRARDLFAQASILDPANPRYLAGYAQAVALQYWNSRDISSAEAIKEAGDAIEKALNLREPSADTLAIAGLVSELRALARNEQSAKEEALNYYEEAVRLEPNNILALQWLASIYLDVNEPDQARAAFDKVVELDPLNTLALTGLANALAALGRIDDARLHLFKMQSLFPERSIVYRYLSNIEYQAGRMDRFVFWIGKAVDADPSPLEIVFLMNGYMTFGWADKALEAAEAYNQAKGSGDISLLVQAELDQNMDALSQEARRAHGETGESYFAILGAWADATAGRCADAVPALENQFPSLKGEVIEYLDNGDLMNAALLAHCNGAIGNKREMKRLVSALLASRLLSDQSLTTDISLRPVRVAVHAMGGDIPSALADLNAIDRDAMPIRPGRISLPIDELPVFEALYDEPDFQEYAAHERYETARQARMLASNETEREILVQLDEAGYSLGR
jgi:TolB-like protein/Tfp pilus assembly protein PilF